MSGTELIGTHREGIAALLSSKMRNTAVARTTAALCIAVALSASQVTSAQTTDRRDALDEIVVTAEKRDSTVQDTAISITAISGERLAQEGITGITGVVDAVPGISMRTAGPGQTELEMRGMSSSGGSSPTVGFYFDDYPLTPPAGSFNGKVVIDPDLFDLNRVEVLRGPQGTLYGSSSMGGTIKLVTNQPNLTKFEGQVEATGSETNGGGWNRGGNIMLNLPLIDNVLAVRVVGTDKFTDGWINRYVVNNFPAPTLPGPACPGWPGCTRGNVLATPASLIVPHTNTEHLQGGRLEVLAKPSDALSINATVMFQKIGSGGYSEYDVPPSVTDAHYEPLNVSEPFTDEFKLYGITVMYDFSFAKLTSATAYYTRTESNTPDNSEAIYSVEGLFGGDSAATGFLNIPFNETDTTRQYSEELRLASNGDSRLQWIGGAFFNHFQSILSDYQANPALAYMSAGGAEANPNGIFYQAYAPYTVKQYAAFGEATYALTDSWKVTAGARYYKFDTDVDYETAGVTGQSGNAAPTYSNFSKSNSGVNPKATISYEQNHDLTVYATVSRGFRPGGVNNPPPPGVCTLDNATYGPDNSWNYEVGEKAKMLDSRVILNADIYYIKWNQVQQLTNQSCGYPENENAGNAATYGPEIELTALLTSEFTLTFSGTYTHATITSVSPSVIASGAPIVEGQPLLNIPKYTETTSLTYRKPISDNYILMARLNNSLVGSSTDVSYDYVPLSSYDLVGLRFGLESKTWFTYLFVDNLTNKAAELGVNSTSFSWTIPSLERMATNQPRTVGLDIKYKF